jgi:hypothetical protein
MPTEEEMKFFLLLTDRWNYVPIINGWWMKATPVYIQPNYSTTKEAYDLEMSIHDCE